MRRTRLHPGASAIPFEAVTAHGVPVHLGDYGDRVLLLSFLRYASCPMCNLRVHELRSAYPTLRARRAVCSPSFVKSSATSAATSLRPWS